MDRLSNVYRKDATAIIDDLTLQPGKKALVEAKRQEYSARLRQWEERLQDPDELKLRKEGIAQNLPEMRARLFLLTEVAKEEGHIVPVDTLLDLLQQLIPELPYDKAQSAIRYVADLTGFVEKVQSPSKLKKAG